MINDEKTKMNLLLAYKICELYLKSNATTSTMSKATEIPLSTIKRSLKMIKNRHEDYLRLLPELGNSKELDILQSQIDDQIFANKKANKWGSGPITLNNYNNEIDYIKELYIKTNPIVDEESRDKIINLRLNGLSIRAISGETGYSLSTIHNITSATKVTSDGTRSNPQK